MTAEAHYKRWFLIVREHLVDEGFGPNDWADWGWRQQHQDGQTPTAAIKAWKRATGRNN